MQFQNDTLLRQLAMLRRIPQHPSHITARVLAERMEAEGFEVSKLQLGACRMGSERIR